MLLLFIITSKNKIWKAISAYEYSFFIFYDDDDDNGGAMHTEKEEKQPFHLLAIIMPKKYITIITSCIKNEAHHIRTKKNEICSLV